ncbi:NAD(P)/FAD-dependent oxidoreductase [Roseateles violae]|uniref:FAD-dependent oxidoreductase n=1 Tax=Roseateles violae TaxID=3058042 RepID=A0ABT8DVN4_9BURK|nr:FAD-dependent oxidoreductase [Pelomonas sp. PFR6]MDN3922146.1 FAD-dependent oxidoreductase [Pelomonas sp. PFR6]
MTREILVLGAGMVGVCTALELQLRGHQVTLVDRRPPGQEASYGNAGVIQREAVEPYAMPRDWRALLDVVFRRGIDVNYHVSGLLAFWPQLLRYWQASAPASHRAISRQYAGLIAHATDEHARLMRLAGAEDLLQRDGLRMIYRDERAMEHALRNAQRVSREYGIRFAALDSRAIDTAEPAFRIPLAGAVHWLDSWNIGDPGALVERYAQLFLQRGGRLLRGNADSLNATASGWQVETDEGPVQAQQAVLALGAWADSQVRRLGYRWPLFVKRGYHRHYTGGAKLNVTTLDAERGYVMAPQLRGLRVTSGAEIACIDSTPTPRQLIGAEAMAGQLLDLGRPVEIDPWMGSRPCCADMKPIIGAAPRHPGLWVNCGHGHQGFTLGPASARLLADLMEGGSPYTEAEAFSPTRFRI